MILVMTRMTFSNGSDGDIEKTKGNQLISGKGRPATTSWKPLRFREDIIKKIIFFLALPKTPRPPFGPLFLDVRKQHFAHMTKPSTDDDNDGENIILMVMMAIFTILMKKINKKHASILPFE